MAHADDATKAWVSATPKKNADGNVIRWNVKYKYTLAATGKADFVHTFEKTEDIKIKVYWDSKNWTSVALHLSSFVINFSTI